MKPRHAERERYQEGYDTRPDRFAGLWQDFAKSSSWDLSNKTVNVSADGSEFDKIIWPKTIKC